MKAVAIESHGEPEVLVPVIMPEPEPSAHEVLVRIRAVGVNRADVLQRRGHYPPPPDAPENVPGLEFAGEIEAVGANVTNVAVGNRVYGLASGGTYAEYICVHSRAVSKIPHNLGYIEAAAIPEAFITAYDAAVVQGGLSAGEYVLITAVGSGVGTAMVQIAKAIGAVSVGTARQGHKLEQAEALGLNHRVLSVDGTFAEEVRAATDGAGVDVVVELVGGKYVAEDVECCAPKGRIIVVGLVAGAKVTADLGMILRKRLTIRGTTMRMRPLEEKIIAAQLLSKNLNPLFQEGILKPIVDRTFKLEEAAQAHVYMEANENFGKIVLEV
jgi:putative PIG3 family NAD(P)H quinone oxidoreductase